jgi:hypothetical protein
MCNTFSNCRKTAQVYYPNQRKDQRQHKFRAFWSAKTLLPWINSQITLTFSCQFQQNLRKTTRISNERTAVTPDFLLKMIKTQLLKSTGKRYAETSLINENFPDSGRIYGLRGCRRCYQSLSCWMRDHADTHLMLQSHWSSTQPIGAQRVFPLHKWHTLPTPDTRFCVLPADFLHGDCLCLESYANER